MREDGDTWDISTSVGMTAIAVAAIRAVESHRADALFTDPHAEHLVAAAGAQRWIQLLENEHPPEDPDAENPFARLRNTVGAFAVGRTRYYDDYLLAATDAGIRQVVILASGLDARAWRLDWPEDTTLFEIDQPKVLDFKATAIAPHAPPGRAVDRRDVAADLREDWASALRERGFDPEQPTAWLAEGLLRYLPSDARERLYDALDELSAPGSRFAANHGTAAAQQSPEVRARAARAFADAGIKLDVPALSYPDEPHTDPARWFAAHGWQVEPTDAASVLASFDRPVEAASRYEVSRYRLVTAILPTTSESDCATD